MSSIKNKIKLIKKIAQGLPDVPGVNPATYRSVDQKTPASTTENVFGPPIAPGASVQPKRFVSYGNPEVKKLQSAILNFADIASKTDVTSLKGNQQGKQESSQSRAVTPISNSTNDNGELHNFEGGAKNLVQDDVDSIINEDVNYKNTINDKEYLGGSDPFGNFIVNNYIPKNSYTGKQYLNVDVVGNKNRENNSMSPQSLRGIIDSMKRVGTPGSTGTEKSIDGIWQTRTNNALHVIADLTQAMLSFTNDMKKPVKGYTQQELDQYKKLVPNSYTDIKQSDINTLSNALTEHIQKMSQFFENLKPAVFENSSLRKYIDQKASFSKYTVLPDDDKLYNRNLSLNISGKQINMSLNDLKNKESFKSLINNYFGDLDPSKELNTLKYVLSEIKKQLDVQSNLSNTRS